MVNTMRDKILIHLNPIREQVSTIEHKTFISELNSIEKRINKCKTINELDNIFKYYTLIIEDITNYVQDYLKNLKE